MIVDRARIEEALPGYDLGAELGRGAFGLVVAGTHRRLGRSVAIKVLSGPDGEATADQRFLDEARVLADFDHPHIVRLHDYVEHRGLCLLVMERLSGGSLGARGFGRVTPEYACGVGLAVADALSAAHGRRVLHRDIKPDNLLFAGDGTVKVADVGIAKLFDGTATASSSFVGSPVYMAPEQASLGRLGPATDLYSLSVVLYRLLTGRPLFAGELSPAAMLLHHQSTPPPPMPDVAPRVAAVILRGLSKDVDDRQPTARAFALDLASAAAGAYGSDWLARAGLPVRVGDELRDAARTSRPGRGGSGVRPFETTVGRRLPDWPWGLPPARLDELALGRDHTEPPPSAVEAEPASVSGRRIRSRRPGPAGRRPGPEGADSRPAAQGRGEPGREVVAWGASRDGALVVTAAPVWLLERPDGGWLARLLPRGRAVAGGAAVLGAALAAIVVGLGVSTFSTGPDVVPGPGGVVAVGTTIYVSDPAHDEVRRIDARGLSGSSTIVVAGNGTDGYSGDGGDATKASLSDPGSLAVDGDGNLYIADQGNRRVRRVDADGTITTVAGGGTRPVSGRASSTSVLLSEPFTITVSRTGVLWIAEQQRNRVSRVTSGSIEAFAGTGQTGFSGDGLYASWALLNMPTAVAVDPEGERLYIADQGNRRIRVVRVGSGFIRTFAGDGTTGPFRNDVQATIVGIPSVFALAAGGDGSVYLGGGDAREVDSQGFVRPVARLRTISISVTAARDVYFVSDERTVSGDRVHRLYHRTPEGDLFRMPW
ncbi:serine/threonine-protein kinase [Cryptosporangium sp. NPDC051539]|uniref:serine/threonine-protein kinase n=1 Tax=Cryptosporangium sp. NPDC051539 TaxID=3363962 RepID=UPI0037B47F3E